MLYIHTFSTIKCILIQLSIIYKYNNYYALIHTDRVFDPTYYSVTNFSSVNVNLEVYNSFKSTHLNYRTFLSFTCYVHNLSMSCGYAVDNNYT